MPLLNHLKSAGAAAGDPVYYFRGKSASYPTSVQTELGVAPSPPAEQTKPVHKVEELLSRGVMIRLRISYGTGAGNKSAKVLCRRETLATALNTLIGKEYKGALVVGVNIPLKDTFY